MKWDHVSKVAFDSLKRQRQKISPENLNNNINKWKFSHILKSVCKEFTYIERDLKKLSKFFLWGWWVVARRGLTRKIQNNDHINRANKDNNNDSNNNNDKKERRKGTKDNFIKTFHKDSRKTKTLPKVKLMNEFHTSF